MTCRFVSTSVKNWQDHIWVFELKIKWLNKLSGSPPLLCTIHIKWHLLAWMGYSALFACYCIAFDTTWIVSSFCTSAACHPQLWKFREEGAHVSVGVFRSSHGGNDDLKFEMSINAFVENEQINCAYQTPLNLCTCACHQWLFTICWVPLFGFGRC
jgi:hypothetical protein